MHTDVDVVAKFNAPISPDDTIGSDLTRTPTPKVADTRRRTTPTTTNYGTVVNHQSFSGIERTWPKNQHVAPKAYVWKASSQPKPRYRRLLRIKYPTDDITVR